MPKSVKGSARSAHPPPQESKERARATLTVLVEAAANTLLLLTEREQRAPELAHQMFALCHDWAMLSAKGLVDGSDASAIDKAIFVLLGTGPSKGSR